MTEILKQIRGETQVWHSRIETLVPVFADSFTLVDYRRLLERFHGFYSQLEPRVAHVSGLKGVLPDWQERRRLPLLEADLRWLGLPEGELARLPVCTSLPCLDDLATAMGAMYVTEGSTLGGQIICRRLSLALGLSPGKGAAFFAGHREGTGSKWRTFTTALSGMAATHDGESIVRSAVETFKVLSLWLSEPERDPFHA